MRHEQNYALFFETLANKLRIGIILELQKGDRTVGELARIVGEEQSKVSHALEALRDCRIVSSSEKGRSRIYKLNSSFIKPLFGLVDMHVCEHCDGCDRLKSKEGLGKRKG